MSRIQSFLGFLRRHKYFVVIAFFAIMIGVVDENSLWDRHNTRAEIADLRAEMQIYKNRYEQDTRLLEELNNNPEAVMRVAREQYLMIYPDEDVFVFMEMKKPEKTVEDVHE